MKKIVLTLILCILLSTTGCWDVRDISNRAYIAAIGLDKGQEIGTDYRVTFEIISPSKLIARSKPATIVETIEGKNVAAAIEKLQTSISRRISLDHFRVLIVGEELGIRAAICEDYYPPLA